VTQVEIEPPSTSLPAIPNVSSGVPKPEQRPPSAPTTLPSIGRPSSAPSPRVEGTAVLNDLQNAHKTQQGNDQVTGSRLEQLRILAKLRNTKFIEANAELLKSVEELTRRIAEKENVNTKNELEIQGLKENLEKLQKESEVHGLDKQKEIDKLKLELKEIETKHREIKATHDTGLDQQKLEIEEQIKKNIQILEALKKEIRDNEQKKDEHMQFIDTQIDELFKMQIGDLEMKEMLQKEQFHDFKELIGDNPTKETYSPAALFLMYESMAGTWKMFLDKKEKGTVDDLITQKVMHEHLLYTSIENHDDDVQKITSKYFHKFKENFEEQKGV
jgi:hypothetical protein